MTQSELIAELVKALEPFADEAGYYDPQEQDGKILDDDYITDDGNGIRVGDFRRAREALSHARAAQSDGWQPIETAPKDGTQILVAYAGWAWVEIASYDEDLRAWMITNDDAADDLPTYWQPLPSPPSKQEGE